MKRRFGPMPSVLRSTATLLMAAAMACAGAAHAAYPEQPITFIMPYGAGGSPDQYGRVFADKLQQRLGQPVIVNNRAGAGGTIGAAAVAHAKPDGYTILYGSTSNTTAAPALFKTLNYDPAKDLVPVSIIAEAFYILIAPESEKGTDLSSYIDQIRKNPGKFSIGGAANTAEVIASGLRKEANLDFTFINYAASSNMMVDLMAGRLQGVITPVAGTNELIAAGKVADLGVFGATKPLPVLPNVTLVNDVIPDVGIGIWTGIFVPAGTPQNVIDTLHENITEVLKEPEIIEISERGGTVVHMSQQEAVDFVRKDMERWPALAKEAGIQPK